MNKPNRRGFLQQAALLGALSGCATQGRPPASRGDRPNVLFILTDDQGYGDLGCHGNPHLRTPHLDVLHAGSVRFRHFYSNPVCSPTRACLMTGRYNYRTGVVDTFQGRSMMHSDEITLAEALGAAGYHTGIFGKWHLGDNYPMRAMDQGFHESLVHKGGGICQPSEPRNNTYFNPILQRNGKDERCDGYCTDIFTDAAIEFIGKHRDEPFFAYVAYNAPHIPLLVEDRYVKPYLDMGLEETTAKVYGMLANLDENVGRMLAALERGGLAENTLVIFMTDNGAQQAGRYNAGARGTKGTVYDGGIRVPFFVRWPKRFPGGRDADQVAAHIDVFPTLLEACGVKTPQDRVIDGRSLMPLLAEPASPWPERNVFLQWHRGDAPEAFRNAAVRGPRYKLVEGKELYDMVADPAESRDIAGERPEMVARMREEYLAWFQDVCSTRGFSPPRIHIGAKQENPTVLTRQDWRGAPSWNDIHVGYWETLVVEEGVYDITLEYAQSTRSGEALFRLNGVERRVPLLAGETVAHIAKVRIPAGAGRLETECRQGDAATGARQVTLRRR